jgi:hypothetical protein
MFQVTGLDQIRTKAGSTMRTRFLLLVIAAMVFVPALMAQNPPLTFVAGLTGANVAGSAGSANGFANATLSISGSQGTLDVATIGLANITGVSLFQGNLGTNGPLIVTFTDVNHPFVNGRFHGTVILDSGAVNAIPANPQNYYLLITTSGLPSGAVRGQLAGANTIFLAGTISGANPVCNGGNGTPGAAGTFAFAMTPDPGGAIYTVRYDIVTIGLGNTLSALQVGDVLTGPALFTLGFNVSGTGGRFTGTGQVSAARAVVLQTLPAGTRLTVTTPETGANCAAAGAIQAGHEIFIPVAGSVHGVGNTNYQTDLNILSNTVQGSTTTADVMMQFFPTGPGSAVAQSVAWATLSPRGMSIYRDVAANGFAGQINGIGAIRLVTAGNIFANARIYNNLIASGGGTFGQYVAGLPRSLALSEGTLLGLSNIVSGQSIGAPTTRTNVGFFNPSDNATTAAFELRDGNGTVISTRTITFAPWQQIQIPLAGGNGLFTDINTDVNIASVYFLSGGPLFVYASIIDNVTGDGSYATPSTSSSGGTGPSS